MIPLLILNFILRSISKMKMREIIFLLCTLACLISKIQTQVIETQIFPTSKTTGNKNAFSYKSKSNRGDLYGLVPAEVNVPLIIEFRISDFVKMIDEYLDHTVLDLANIDPKVSFIIPRTPRFTKNIGFQTRRR